MWLDGLPFYLEQASIWLWLLMVPHAGRVESYKAVAAVCLGLCGSLPILGMFTKELATLIRFNQLLRRLDVDLASFWA